MFNIFDTPNHLATAAAKEFYDRATSAIADHGVFMLALAGGTTPRETYEMIAADYAEKIDWEKVYIFFGDERNVASDSEESNYKRAYDTLISKVRIPSNNIHRIRTELGPSEAADSYNKEIIEVFTRFEMLSPAGLPVFDLIFLGMGEDGHVASLFPETIALMEKQRLVTPNFVPKLQESRITFTAHLINASRCVIFLVSGKGKAGALKAVFDPQAVIRLPAGMIKAAEVLWFCDRDAAVMV